MTDQSHQRSESDILFDLMKNKPILNLAYPKLDDPDYVYKALLDHGLFFDKLPPCFTSKGLGQATEKIKRNESKHYIRYSAFTFNCVSREMGIPHPIAYKNLCKVIKDNWLEINKKCFNETKVSFCHVSFIEDKPHIFEMTYNKDNKHSQEDTEINYRIGAEYVVKADISKCFPSIYTHSIPWAIHGKGKAKKKRESKELWGNKLDKATRETNSQQTVGLFIGPHASNIIAEIVLSEIDRKLIESGFKTFTRHIDDYKFYAEDAQEAQEFMRKLRTYLSQYELSLNDKKTKITKLPDTQFHWKEKLGQFIFLPTDVDEESKDKVGLIGFTSVDAYLSLAMSLEAQEKDLSPIKYALRILMEKYEAGELKARCEENLAKSIIALCIHYPYFSPLIAEILEPLIFQKKYGLASIFIEKLFKSGIEYGYMDALAFVFYFAIKYGISVPINAENFASMKEFDDCISLVLLYEYLKANSSEKENAGFLKEIESLAKEKNDDDDDDDDDDDEGSRFWLLSYQCLPASDLSDDGLKELKNKNFEFIRWDFEKEHSITTPIPNSFPQ